MAISEVDLKKWGNGGAKMADKFPTEYKGIRYRKHKTRKYGVRYDRYFFIRYKLNGKLKDEGWGWESEGFAAKDASKVRDEIMLAIKTGSKIITLAERKAEAARKRAEEARAAEKRAKADVTFDEFFEDFYKKHRESKALVPELPLYKYWVKPIIGHKKFSEIGEIDMAAIKREALKERKIRKKVNGVVETVVKPGKSLRTVEYCYSVVRMVFNMAATHGIYSGNQPITKAVKKNIKYDNRKTRYLTPDEAERLLAALAVRSKQTHDMAVLALYCGLRAGEVCGLDWSDVDLSNKMLTMRDTKSSKTRTVPMPDQVQEMFKGQKAGKGNVPVFVGADGGRLAKVSKTFPRTVADLGFNEGVTDRRQKVTFHTLRHTYASWLVQAGAPLLTVQKLLGHSTIRMTERYSHLAPDNLRQAADILSSMGTVEASAEKIVNISGDGTVSLIRSP